MKKEYDKNGIILALEKHVGPDIDRDTLDKILDLNEYTD